jgi:hypothetical protein
VIALTAHSVSGKDAAGAASSLFADPTIGGSDSAIPNANKLPSTDSTSVSFQDFGSAFSEMLSASSTVSSQEDEAAFTKTQSNQDGFAIQSRVPAGAQKSSGPVQTNDSSKSSRSYQATSGLLASLRARSNVESGLHNMDTSSVSPGAKTQQMATQLSSGDLQTADRPSWQGQSVTVPAPITNDGSSPGGESTTLSAGATSTPAPPTGESDVQSAADQLMTASVLRADNSSAPTAKAGDPAVKTESAIASSEKDVPAFTLVLSKATNTNRSQSPSEKVVAARQVSTSVTQLPDKAAVIATSQTPSESMSDQSDKQEPKKERGEQDLSVASSTSSAEAKSSPAHTTAADDNGGDPPVAVVAKEISVTKSERPAASAEITADTGSTVLSPTTLASSVRESGRTLQSSTQVQPTDLQGSSAATSAKEVVMKIQGQSGETISVRLVDQGGQIQVGVRSSDPNTAASLRQDLSSLTSNLERAGWKTEATSMVPEAVLTANNSKPGSDDSESSSGRNYPEWQEQSGRRKQTTADLWDDTLDRQNS